MRTIFMRLFWITLFIVGCFIDNRNAPSVSAQEANNDSTKQEKSSDRDQRLSDLERQLQRLANEIKELRGTTKSNPTANKDKDKSKEKDTVKEKSLAAAPKSLDPKWLQILKWRSIGPANMGGRIVDLAVVENDPSTFWVATASGGLLKTTNNGVTFEHQFEHEATVSIGAVSVAPSDPNIVWVGTGEANPRNSVSYGDGVYKSVDGGKTWKCMGLKKSYQVGRILIHPKNPEIVYVGVLGRLYGPSEERGLFKTTDGGQTWQKVFYVDDRTGIIDAVMNPEDPETLIVAMWERLRDGFDSWPGSEVKIQEGYDGYDPIKKWGASGGLYKTTDGGKSFRKLANGLPTSPTGRIGLDWQRGSSHEVFAVIDCESIAKGPQPLPVYLGLVGKDSEGKAIVTQILPKSPAEKAGIQVNDVLTVIGDKSLKQFDELLDELRSRKPGEKIALTLQRGDKEEKLEIALTARPGTAAQSPVWIGGTGEEREGRVTLTQIVPDSPAAKAGLQADDVVTTLDGKEVKTFEALVEQVREKSAGDQVKLQVQRGDEKKEITITLENRPGAGGATSSRRPSDAYLGVQGEDAEGGAKLIQITPDAPAEKAGLQVGDIVQAINEKKIGRYEEFADELAKFKPGDKVALTILRGTETKQITATMDARPGGPSRTRPYSFSYGGQSPNIQDQQGSQGHLYGGIYRSKDGGETWDRINSLTSRPMYFSVVRADPGDSKHVYALGVSQYSSHNGGVTFEANFGRTVHADGHALWINPRDGRHMIIGTDGGVYVSYDRGANWDHLNHAAIGQFYHVAISPKSPYHVTGGLQDNGTWFGPSQSLRGSGPINEDWVSVGGGDGFMCRVDPNEPDLVYFTSQNGAMSRRNLRTGERASIRPVRARGEPSYRFNWNSPFILSNQNSRIFYCAGNYVFRSLDRGNNLQKISPEITLTKRGSATALSESPRNPNILYVGTDDGALWVTRDGGQKWTDITKKIGLPAPRWIATVEASRHADGRVYVCCDGHRSDDDEPHVFVSEDYGETWKSLRNNLPIGSTRCLREDLSNANLLYLGTEFGAWCSIDRGQAWTKFNNNLPTVAVHEFALHPTNGDLVAATHGRSLWITDITPLREFSMDRVARQPFLLAPATATRWLSEPARGRTNRRFIGTNPPSGALLYFSLPKKAKQVSLKIQDIGGATLRELRVPTEPGLHQVVWDLVRTPTRSSRSTRGRTGATQPSSPPSVTAAAAQGTPAQEPMLGEAEENPAGTTQATAVNAPRTTTASREEGTPSASRSRSSTVFGAGGSRIVAPGTYRVVLNVDGQEHVQTLRVDADPNLPPGQVMTEEEVFLEETQEDRELRKNFGWPYID